VSSVQELIPKSFLMALLMAILYVVFFCMDAVSIPFLLPMLFVLSLLDPKQIPWSLVMLVGGLQDVVTDFPLGLHSFLYALYGLFLSVQRRFLFKRGFFLTWVVFAMTCFSFLLLTQILLYVGGKVPRMPVSLLVQGAVLVGIFPLFFQGILWLFTKMRVMHEST
jgi:hypothetical protein